MSASTWVGTPESNPRNESAEQSLGGAGPEPDGPPGEEASAAL
ncbi:hypothetical protein [Streptomyces sp. NPDC003023]